MRSQMPNKKTTLQGDQGKERFGYQGKPDTTKGFQASGQIDLDNIEIPEPSDGVQPAQNSTSSSSSSGD